MIKLYCTRRQYHRSRFILFDVLFKRLRVGSSSKRLPALLLSYICGTESFLERADEIGFESGARKTRKYINYNYYKNGGVPLLYRRAIWNVGDQSKYNLSDVLQTATYHVTLVFYRWFFFQLTVFLYFFCKFTCF